MLSIFFVVKEICIGNYTDYNKPYISTDNIGQLISSSEEASKILFKWFVDNRLNTNTDKRHFLASGTQNAYVEIGNFCMGKNTRNF